MEHRVGQTIDPKNTGEKLQSITDPSAAMLVGLAGEAVFSAKERLANASLDGVKDLDFPRIGNFIAWLARHHDLLGGWIWSKIQQPYGTSHSPVFGWPLDWFEGKDGHRHRSASRRLRAVSVEEILWATAKAHHTEPEAYAKFRSSAAGRDMAAWLCRQWTGATLSELGASFGLKGTDSVSNLIRRANKRHQESDKWRRTATRIERSIGLKTEHKA